MSLADPAGIRGSDFPEMSLPNRYTRPAVAAQQVRTPWCSQPGCSGRRRRGAILEQSSAVAQALRVTR